MINYTQIIFDADNTLFDFDRAEETALINTLAHFNMPTPSGLIEFYRAMNMKLWQQLDKKIITIAQLKQQRTEKLFEFVSQEADPAAFSWRYLDELAGCQFLLAGVEDTLQQLSGHCEMAIITNGLARVQKPRLAASSIEKHFGALVISEELGVAKPDPEIFAHTCDLMNWSDPSKVLMVGDNYRCDVQGANNFGMQTCWFNIRQQVCDFQAHDLNVHDHEINAFKQLLAFV